MEFAAIGLGLSSGIGTELANDDETQTTVTFCGDAGFMMSLQELDTAARYNVPLLVIVMNDDALGAEYAQLASRGHSTKAAVVDSPDFAALAAAFGVDGYTVRSVADLTDLGELLGEKPDGPVLIDCKIDRDVIHRGFE